MERKYYTFLIFPGVHGKIRKVQCPFYVLHLILGLSLIGMVALGTLANTYARMLLKVSNYNNVRNEREALKTREAVKKSPHRGRGTGVSRKS